AALVANGATHHLAAFGTYQAGNGLERGALAGAVGTEQGHHLALADLQGHAAHREYRLLVEHFYVIDLQDHLGLRSGEGRGTGPGRARGTQLSLLQSRAVMPFSSAYLREE